MQGPMPCRGLPTNRLTELLQGLIKALAQPDQSLGSLEAVFANKSMQVSLPKWLPHLQHGRAFALLSGVAFRAEPLMPRCPPARS